MAKHTEQKLHRWGDETQPSLDMSRAELISHSTFLRQAGSASEPASGAAHTAAPAHGPVSHELPAPANITLPPQPEPDFRKQTPGTGLSPAKWLLELGKMTGHTLRTAVASIKNHLIKRRQNGWRPTHLIAFVDAGEWKWSRACCRIVQNKEAVVVSIGMHNHDISGVEVKVHKNTLAIRIQLGSKRMLLRAEPLPTAVQETLADLSWDRDEIRIELQAT